MLEIILLVVTFCVLFAASYSDLKSREIPDLLTYGFLFAVLGIRVVFSFEEGWYTLLEGILGLGITFVFGFLLYLTHQWGGGDTKLLFGLGVVFGIGLPLGWNSFGLIFYILLVFLVGAIYGLLWMLILALRNRCFWKEYRKVLAAEKIIHYILLCVLALSFVAMMFNVVFVIFGIFPILIFYLLIFVQLVEKLCFVKNVSPKNVTEGDWMVGKVYVGSNLVLDKRTLEQEDVVLLRRLYDEGKLHDVTIKEGIPFAPSFLIGLVVLILLNNFLSESLFGLI